MATLKTYDVWQEDSCTLKAGREFVIWSLYEGKPVIRQVLKVVDISASFSKGVRVKFTRQPGETFEISHKSGWIYLNIKLGLSDATKMRYDPDKGGPFRLAVQAYAQQPRWGGTLPLEGRTAFSSVPEFQDLWPGII